MSELVSIILPIYNGEKYMRQSIDSVIAQTYTNWELLIIDDGSTDRTAEIAKEYEEKDARISYHKNPQNMRLPRTLNRGFSLAKGDYLTWTSDDNRYRPHALETMLATLKEKNVGLVFASYQVIDENDKELRVISVQNGSNGRVLDYNVVGACFLYTREVYKAVGDYDTELFLVEDWDYWQRVMMKFPSYAITQILYDYRQHSASLTSTKNNVRFGEVSEKMLLKNRPGFGKLTLQENSGYYHALYIAREYQGGKNPYAFKHRYYKWLCRIIGRIKK